MDENAPNQGMSEPVIRFKCDSCGKQIRVPSIHAGKKGKCPQCKNPVVIPQLTLPLPTPRDDEPIRLKRDSDMPPESDRPVYEVPKQHRMAPEPDPNVPATPPPHPQRKYPLLIDVFFYPANFQGLIFLAIAVLVPLVIQSLGLLLYIFGSILSFFEVAIGLYVYWFLAQCVRDSASGGLRAPETMAETPGIDELIWQVFVLFACLAICAAPAVVCFLFTQKTTSLFWLLAGCGAFIYPMTFLSVIMFDSIHGLNPLIIIPSIFSAFVQYCGLVVIISVIIFLYVQMTRVLPLGFFVRMVLSPLFQVFELYLAMIAAHLLGRFYFRYQKKLNWEV